MIIERVWAPPSKDTFTIEPIADLLKAEMDDISWNFRRHDNNIVKLNRIWIDPFCGKTSPANIKNDINTKIEADYHLDAIDFLKLFKDKSVDGVLFYPPYSVITYSVILKTEIARIVKDGGKTISFGWNSGGMGKNLGFEITRILLVPHGGIYNDTIVTVEIKRDLLENTAYVLSNIDNTMSESVKC